MFQVIFYDDYDNEEVRYSKLFNTKSEADIFGISCEYDYQDIVLDADGNEYWKTFYRYYNPEDKESYNGYIIKEL